MFCIYGKFDDHPEFAQFNKPVAFSAKSLLNLISIGIEKFDLQEYENLGLYFEPSDSVKNAMLEAGWDIEDENVLACLDFFSTFAECCERDESDDYFCFHIIKSCKEASELPTETAGTKANDNFMSQISGALGRIQGTQSKI